MSMNGRSPAPKRVNPKTSRIMLRVIFALVVSCLLILAFFATNALSH